nr:MAG TPA: hypothetical protein [Caudoviricetes sp.]
MPQRCCHGCVVAAAGALFLCSVGVLQVVV